MIRKTILSTLTLSLLSFALAFNVHAQSCTINTSVNGNAGTGNFSGTIGQSFTACGSGTLATIWAQASNTSAATSIVRIYNGEGTNGTLLGTSAAIAVSSNRTNTWNIENLNIKVVSGQKYTAIFSTASGTPTFQYSTSTQYNYYAGGQVFYVGAANNDMFFRATIVKLSPTLSPAHLSSNVSRISPISLQFDRAMKVNTGNVFLKNLSSSTTDTINVAALTVSGSMVTFPSRVLAKSTNYEVIIPASALSSTSGISYEGLSAGQWTFTTSGKAAVTLTATSGTLTNATTIPLNIVFTEAVTGLAASDFVITNGTAGTLTGSGTNYSLNIAPGASGLVRVSLPVDQTTEGNEPASTSVFFDNVAPTVVTKNDTLRLNSSGTGTIAVADINNGSSDNTTKTANLVLSLSKTAFNCANLGINTVTLTVQDSVGNIGTATAQVLVLPLQPQIITKSFTTQLNAAGVATITPQDINNNSLSYCGTTLSFTLDKSSFDCSKLGANTVTLTGNDGAGNLMSATATVTVQNKVLPTVATKNTTVQIDLATGNANITPQMIDNGSAGNCGGAVTLSLSKTNFKCTEVGAHTVTLTATDAQGNIATGTATVTVVAAVQDLALTETDAVVASGAATTITTASSQQGVNYLLKSATNNSPIGSPVSGTGNALSFNTGALTATQSFKVVGETYLYNNYALDFDGVNDLVNTGITMPAATAFTIEAWIYPRATGYKRLITNFTNAAVSGEFLIDTYNATDNGKALRFLLKGAGTASQTVSVANVLTLNDWNHIACTFENGNMKTYVNGTMVGFVTASFTSVAANNNTIRLGEDITIGTLEYFNGKMDEVRIWTTARTAQQIAANMNTCLAGNEAGLKNYIKMTEGAGATVKDVVTNTNGTMSGNGIALWAEGKLSCVASTCAFEMSDIATVTVSGVTAIDETKLSESTSWVYPNPATSTVYTSHDVEIYSSTGILMMTGKGKIDVSNLPKGMYLVKSALAVVKLAKE